MRDIKGKENIGVAFKAKSTKADKHRDKEEKDNAKIQATFQSVV